MPKLETGPPSGIPQARLDEIVRRYRNGEAVELSIAPKSQVNKLWDLLNKPFLLWTLSTVVVGSLSFLYTLWGASRSEEMRLRQEAKNCRSEISLRTKRLSESLKEFKSNSQKAAKTKPEVEATEKRHSELTQQSSVMPDVERSLSASFEEQVELERVLDQQENALDSVRNAMATGLLDGSLILLDKLAPMPDEIGPVLFRIDLQEREALRTRSGVIPEMEVLLAEQLRLEAALKSIFRSQIGMVRLSIEEYRKVLRASGVEEQTPQFEQIMLRYNSALQRWLPDAHALRTQTQEMDGALKQMRILISRAKDKQDIRFGYALLLPLRVLAGLLHSSVLRQQELVYRRKASLTQQSAREAFWKADLRIALNKTDQDLAILSKTLAQAEKGSDYIAVRAELDTGSNEYPDLKALSIGSLLGRYQENEAVSVSAKKDIEKAITAVNALHTAIAKQTGIEQSFDECLKMLQKL